MKRTVSTGTARCAGGVDPSCEFDGTGCTRCTYREHVVESCDWCDRDRDDLTTFAVVAAGDRVCADCVATCTEED